VEYLGVTFDSGLTWRRHIDRIVSKSRKRVNFMRSIAGKSWGCHTESQLVLFKSIVRPILEYGSFMFLTSAGTYQVRLRRVQWAALRVALGSFPSSPNAAVEVITQVEPLVVRFERLARNYLLRNFVGRSHPATEAMTALVGRTNNKFVQLFEQQMGTASRLTLGPEEDLFDPVDSYRANVDIDLVKHIPKRATLHAAEANEVFDRYLLQHYEDFEVVYTDGSKMESGVGASFVHGDCQRRIRLSAVSSNYIAEMTALYYAVEHIGTHPKERFVVATDSLSCLQRLDSPGYRSDDPALLRRIRHSLESMRAQGKQVWFLWCPSHKGLRGNEQADVVASEACESGYDSFLFQEKHCLRTRINDEAVQQWQIMWDNAPTGRFTYSICPRVGVKPWFKGLDLPRSVLVTNTRILLNHYGLGGHMARFSIVDSPICACGEDYETVNHVLWHCPLRQDGREDFVRALTNSGIITGDVRNLFSSKDTPAESYIRVHTFLRRHRVNL
jgi:ribonuclease HI